MGLFYLELNYFQILAAASLKSNCFEAIWISKDITSERLSMKHFALFEKESFLFF